MTNPLPASYSTGTYCKHSFKIRNNTGMSPFTFLIQHCTGSPSQSSQITRRNKRHQIGKEEVKLSLLADDMILYIENLKDSTKKLLEVIDDFSRVTGYKINIQNHLHFICQ